ncbi:MAG: DUF5050 domain-containing protein, partial [Clostridiales bacterium]|nr:DUF5050 domain-containing protein [Clostridiales bacterium]
SENISLEALALESIYDEDENEYGNSIGNVYNQGMLVSGVSGATYFHDMYDGRIYMILEDGIVAFLLAEESIYQLNYMDGVLYGVNMADNSIISYEISNETTNVLREAGQGVWNLQLVNDRLYFIDSSDSSLRSITIDGEDEQILVEEVDCAFVYKDVIIFSCVSEGDVMYCLPIEGGDAVQLGSQEGAGYPIVYENKIYYAVYGTEQDGIYVMNLDGSDNRMIYEDTTTQLNLYDGVLYYVNGDDETKICSIDLETEEVSEWDLDDKIIAVFEEAYGEDGYDTIEIVGYGDLSFNGDYMMFVCGEMMDGVTYTDQFIYNRETGALYSVAQIAMDGSELDYLYMLYEDEYTSGSADAGDTASTDRDYPAGDYTVGSVYGPKLTQSQLNDVADAVQEFLNLYDTESMDDYTKILTAHDYLCETCSYAADWSVNGANTAWGALIYHEAQCSGYARAMKALCDAMGVGCYYVHASDDASNPSHQWNVCCVDGSWYIVDVQCNDSSGFKAYFLVSDATYQTSGMRWDTSSVPECPEDYVGELK